MWTFVESCLKNLDKSKIWKYDEEELIDDWRHISMADTAVKPDYEFIGDFSDEAKKDFLEFLNELHENEHNCGVVSHTNHSNHNNW